MNETTSAMDFRPTEHTALGAAGEAWHLAGETRDGRCWLAYVEAAYYPEDRLDAAGEPTGKLTGQLLKGTGYAWAVLADGPDGELVSRATGHADTTEAAKEAAFRGVVRHFIALASAAD